MMSPGLFPLFTHLVKDKLGHMDGVWIGGRNINSIRYPDDIVLIADSDCCITWQTNILQEQCTRMRLKLSIGKTEFMEDRSTSP